MEAAFLSLQEVADELGVSEQTVRRWVKRGELRAYQPGRAYRIHRDDLVEFVKGHEARPKGPSPLADTKEWREPVLISAASGAGGGAAASIIVEGINERFDALVADLRDRGFGEDVVAEFEALREQALRAVGAA